MAASITSRPRPGHVNLHEPGDYPIILGDSLKETEQTRSQLMQVRYNWEPRNGFQRRKGVLKQSDGNLKLTYEDDESSASGYNYQGHSTSGSVKEGKESSQLVLIFDEARSAFVLERITKSVDLNVTSAPGQSSEDVKRHRRLRKSPSRDDKQDSNSNTEKLSENDEEHAADSSNPYDFRHFLTEAKENAEKASQAGNRTPLPGSRTPMSGIASPSMGPGRFANTPIRSTPTSAAAFTKRNKPLENGSKLSSTTTSRKLGQSKKKDTASTKTSTQPLSNERISDSDEEMSDVATIAPRASKGHSRGESSSGHVVISDGDLEVDMGTPPQQPKRRIKLDMDVFGRSQTHTPVAGVSSNKAPPRPRDLEIEFKGQDMSDEGEDEDEDVEEFELGSPQSNKKVETLVRHEPEAAPTPPTPIAPTQADDEEYDAVLAAELEEALREEEEEEEEGDDDDTGGSGTYNNHVVEDESEISEEE